MNTPHGAPQNHRGFTLIELLVVIAIIAILAAILFPVFATAREKARQTSCASNMKQLGIAFLQYEQDYDELNPSGYPGGSNSWQGSGWASCIYPYVKSMQAFSCPDDTTLLQTATNNTSDTICSYAVNTQLQTVSMTKCTAVAKTVQLIEVTGVQIHLASGLPLGWNPSWGSSNDCSTVSWQNSPGSEGYGLYCNNHGSPHFQTGYLGGRGVTCGPNNYCATNQSDGLPIFSSPTGRHNLGANYLLADGHVKWLTGDKVSSGTTAPNSTYAQGNQNAAGAEVSIWSATFSAI